MSKTELSEAELPEVDLYRSVYGQAAAVLALRAASMRPVHAYLLAGPPGSGKRSAANAFAAALLCPAGGDGTCDVCLRVLAGTHPDLVVVEREGAALSIESAREITRLAARSPVEGDRKVLLLNDFHLVREAGPALLKTVEEPPPSAVFVILAEHVPPELVTIASRCVRIDFAALSIVDVASALESAGVAADLAKQVAAQSGGRLDRARLAAADPAFLLSRDTWSKVPDRLDGSGANAAVIADELVALLDRATLVLKARQDQQVADLDAGLARMNEVNGRQRGGRLRRPGAKELEDQHKRELRRLRTDELRAGLATLASTYRGRLIAGGEPGMGSAAVGASLQALEAIHKLNKDLEYNPGELVGLQALMVRLGRALR